MDAKNAFVGIKSRYIGSKVNLSDLYPAMIITDSFFRIEMLSAQIDAHLDTLVNEQVSGS